VAAAVVEQRRIFLASREALGDDEKETAPDRKVRDKDVQYRDQGYQHTARNRELPVWIVQGSVSGKGERIFCIFHPEPHSKQIRKQLGIPRADSSQDGNAGMNRFLLADRCSA
jgi:hypothetical protein